MEIQRVHSKNACVLSVLWLTVFWVYLSACLTEAWFKSLSFSCLLDESIETGSESAEVGANWMEA